MDKFNILTSGIIPLPKNDIDTDQIIPARYLKVTDKSGLAEGLFSSWRYLDSGEDNPDFPLNQAVFQDFRILLTGNNFGCGSSREHAPWALMQWGIRVIISTSFADIFYNNALKNGLLPVQVEQNVYLKLVDALEADPLIEATVNLPQQELSLPGPGQIGFSIDPFSKKCLEEGLDPLGYLRQFDQEVSMFERNLNQENIFRISTL